MKFFLDTASLKDISWAAQAGLIDGITTNPSLLSKQAGDLDPRDVLKEICSLVEGPVSAEVVAVDSSRPRPARAMSARSSAARRGWT
jgi:transaldolase